MDAVREHYDIEFISLFGHLSYQIINPDCHKKSERRSDTSPCKVTFPYCISESLYHKKTYRKIITCPFCHTDYEIEYDKNILRREI